MPSSAACIEPDDPRIGSAAESVGRGLISRDVLVRAPAHPTVLRAHVDLARTPAEVLDFCLSGEGFTSIMPDPITVVSTTSERGELGGTYAFRWRMKSIIPVRWVAFIDSLEEGREFSDIQLRGVFRYFHHTHTCEPLGTGTRYTDTVRFLGPLGRWADERILLPQLRATFAHRHRRMRELLGEAP